MTEEKALMAASTATELAKANERYQVVRDDIHEFAQGVTDFQIECFIANGEGPIAEFPTHAYRHLLAQVRPLISEIRRVAISRERKLREAARTRSKIEKGGGEDLDLDLMELEFALEELDIDLKGKWSTYATYDRLLEHLREKYGPFTHEQLQQDEAKYWRYRLSKQMTDSLEGARSGFGSGNLNSLRMAIQGSELPESPHRIDSQVPIEDPAKLAEEVGRVAFKQLK